MKNFLMVLLVKTLLTMLFYTGFIYLGQIWLPWLHPTWYGYVMCFVWQLVIEVIAFVKFLNKMRDADVAAISKVTTYSPIQTADYQAIVTEVESKGFKLKNAKVKRTYLFFGRYVYTIKFTKA